MRRWSGSRNRTLKAINPLKAFAMAPEDNRVQRAIEVACRDRQGLPDESDGGWYGWPLPEEPRHRYVAVGVEQRGFVVDVVSGHIIWEGEIEGRRRLPRSIADTVKRD